MVVRCGCRLGDSLLGGWLVGGEVGVRLGDSMLGGSEDWV